MIRWDAAPPQYAVGFTTRQGGVSEGAFASLNLGSRVDDAEIVAENRRRACAELGLDAGRLVANRQRHTATVHRALPGADRIGDALWTDEPNVPLLAMTADCVPIAIATTTGNPALAVVHAGWRGLAAGVIGASVAALGQAETTAVIGPAIGPCCYEVGEEVSSQFDPSFTNGRKLDLWRAAELALSAAGVATVERLDLCTSCNADLFFSFRRDGAPHGVQGVIGALVA